MPAEIPTTIQRTDMRGWAMLPITRGVRWAVWKPAGRGTVVEVYAPGVTVTSSPSPYNKLSHGDYLIIDASDEQISKWKLE